MVQLKNINCETKLTNYLVENKLINMTVLDVGARGGFSSYWTIYKDQLEIIGFEPDKKECQESKGKCLACALSEFGEERDFYITAYPASSSFYPPNIEFTNRLQNRDFLKIVQTVKLKTLTLDQLNLKPDFIKLDTEGSELDILKGGVKTLEGVIGLSIEVEFVELFKGQHLFYEVNEFLRDKGFQLFDLETSRLSRYNPNTKGMSDNHHGQIIQGQALYFRDNLNKETTLKQASLYELFSLNDCAYELLNLHYPELCYLLQ